MIEILSATLIVIGLFLLFAGTLGLLRLPDLYCRMHSVGKSDTIGIVLCLSGIAIYNLTGGLTLVNILVSLKIMTIAVFWLIANPTATHALARSAYQSGIKPWTKDGITEIDLDEKRAMEGERLQAEG